MTTVTTMVYFNCEINSFFQEYMYFETSKRRGIFSTLTCGICWRWQAEINYCTFMFWGSQGL